MKRRGEPFRPGEYQRRAPEGGDEADRDHDLYPGVKSPSPEVPDHEGMSLSPEVPDHGERRLCATEERGPEAHVLIQKQRDWG